MIEELDRELRAVGVPARRRRRIRLELEDHLACDPTADLGDPAALARQFADELGTAYARRAGYTVFIALVPIGVLSILLAVVGADVVNIGTILGGQLAFVGGTLAVLRAWRLRRVCVVSTAEATVVRRRVLLGVGGGTLTLVGILIGTGEPRALATVAVGAVTLGVATAAGIAAARLRPTGSGEARDLAFDLGVDTDPWRLAFAIAGAVALCIAFNGVVQSDPLAGVVQAVGDGILCLAGFALLGRSLGLRRQAA